MLFSVGGGFLSEALSHSHLLTPFVFIRIEQLGLRLLFLILQTGVSLEEVLALRGGDGLGVGEVGLGDVGRDQVAVVLDVGGPGEGVVRLR